MTEIALERGQLLLAAFVFVAVLLLVEGLHLLWASRRSRQAQRLAARLAQLGAEAKRAKARVMKDRGERTDSLIAKWLLASGRMEQLQRWVEQAGLPTRAERVMLGSLAAAVIVAGLLLVIFNSTPLVTLAGSLAAGAIPWLAVLWLRQRRLDRIARQLPEAIDFIVRALRSGHALTSALMMCGDELPDPIAGELRLTHDEISFGASLEQALNHLGERVPLTDLRYLIVAVLIQRESGGNLTEVLQNLSQLIRNRFKLESKVKVLSADGRMSAGILMAAPFALGAIMNMSNPQFMSRLWTDPIGIAILKTLGILMVIGFFVLRKITRIRV